MVPWFVFCEKSSYRTYTQLYVRSTIGRHRSIMSAVGLPLHIHGTRAPRSASGRLTASAAPAVGLPLHMHSAPAAAPLHSSRGRLATTPS